MLALEEVRSEQRARVLRLQQSLLKLRDRAVLVQQQQLNLVLGSLLARAESCDRGAVALCDRGGSERLALEELPLRECGLKLRRRDESIRLLKLRRQGHGRQCAGCALRAAVAFHGAASAERATADARGGGVLSGGRVLLDAARGGERGH